LLPIRYAAAAAVDAIADDAADAADLRCLRHELRRAFMPPMMSPCASATLRQCR